MHRRTVIRQLAFVSGTFLFIPSCLQQTGNASIKLKNIPINGDQEKLLAELSETIIPKTDTPGAKEISAHHFALIMLDDCFKAEDQQKFMAGLKAFQTKVKKKFNKPFIDCTSAQKETLLTELEAKKTSDENLDYFYATTRKLTIQAYTTSKFYLTNVQVYKLVPGQYYSCVPVKKVS